MADYMKCIVNCIDCGTKTEVKDSRVRKNDSALYRRRKCPKCGLFFSTREIGIDEYNLLTRYKRIVLELKKTVNNI